MKRSQKHKAYGAPPSRVDAALYPRAAVAPPAPSKTSSTNPVPSVSLERHEETSAVRPISATKQTKSATKLRRQEFSSAGATVTIAQHGKGATDFHRGSSAAAAVAAGAGAEKSKVAAGAGKRWLGESNANGKRQRKFF